MDICLKVDKYVDVALDKHWVDKAKVMELLHCNAWRRLANGEAGYLKQQQALQLSNKDMNKAQS
eukprot:254527-Ditylum_brightwellii.AAC.1